MRHLSYANVVASVALFIALGGTAVATHETIFSDDIVDGQIQRQDLATGAVANTKILDGGIATSKLQAYAVTTKRIDLGAVTGPRLAPNAVNGVKVADDSLTGADINESSLVLPGMFWAVANDGSLARGRGVSSLESLGNGAYRITFDSDLSNCAVLASVSGSPGGEVSAAINPSVPTEVTVQTASSNGTLEDRNFAVAALC